MGRAANRTVLARRYAVAVRGFAIKSATGVRDLGVKNLSVLAPTP